MVGPTHALPSLPVTPSYSSTQFSALTRSPTNDNRKLTLKVRAPDSCASSLFYSLIQSYEILTPIFSATLNFKS